MSKGKKGKSQLLPPKVDRCIFCELKPLSEEHFWPVWMRDVITEGRKEANDIYTSNKHIFEASLDTTDSLGQKEHTEEAKWLTGPVTSRKLKVVCENCNNTWMSRIEDEVKEILSPLILSKSVLLAYSDKEKISTWFYLKTIIGEYLIHEPKTIGKKERQAFYTSRNIPAEWNIYIGRVDPPDWSLLHAQPVTKFGYLNHYTQRHHDLYTKTSMMVVGPLILYAATFPNKDGILPTNAQYDLLGEYSKKMNKIFPIKRSFFSRCKKLFWNRFLPLTSNEVKLLEANARAFHEGILLAIKSNTLNIK